ncbi:MAG: CsbD family protein [Senegalia sp. (in: firmicutes)]|uniref:CsbD family protein n=1 Tax=Senegalia sp. (in: firmicutes) TaxID=1924098 RepID=UPI003F94B782
MDKSDFKAKWTQVKGEAQRKWGKLTNDDLDVIEGDREKLVGKLQERYDMSREEAEREVDSFRM